MKKSVKKVFLKRIFQSLVLPIVMIPSAWACDCVGPPTFPENLALNEEVFQGQVENTETEQSAGITDPAALEALHGPDWALKNMDKVPDPYDLRQKRTTFRVKKVWKGRKEPVKQVFTPANDGVCGVVFDLNAEYLVFASKDPKGDLYTTSCSATQSMESAAEDLDTLGPGEAVEA